MLTKQLTTRLARLTLTVALLVGLALTAPPRPTQARLDSFETPDALRALPVPALEQADTPLPGLALWTGAGDDGRWSNPANWAGHRAPGARDLVRLTGAQDVLFDAASPIAGLVLDANFSGVLYRARPLDVAGELVIEGGQLAPGEAPKPPEPTP